MTDSRTSCDALIIGTGQAGKPLARALAKAGRRTVIVERGPVGGTCINVGCTPTKTLVASARAAWMARHAAGYGVQVGPVAVDMAAVHARTQGLVDLFRDGSQTGLERTDGVELVFGDARFTGARTVAVALRDGGTRALSAPWVFVNVGGRPAPPRVAGVDTVDPARLLDSSTILQLDTLPSHLVVLGGGYIGLEFGQMFRRFGSAVTIVQRGPRLLGREDPDVGAAVREILTEDGCTVHCATPAERLTPADDGGITLHASGPNGPVTISSSHCLVATGRVPNTDTLDCAAAGIALDARGFIPVSDTLETSAPGVWALGDVRGGPAFTHIAYDDYRIVAANLLGDGGRSLADQVVPSVVYIDPQLGRIGLDEQAAAAAGVAVDVHRLPMDHVARALEVGETRGFVKAVVEHASGRILGATVLGVEGGELMTTLQIAMQGGITAAALRDTVFAHPTLAECLNTLFARA